MKPSWLKNFEDFVNSPNPAFACYPCGKGEQGGYIARVKHLTNRPAKTEDVEKMRKLDIPNIGEMAAFYSMYNGVYLFCEARAVENKLISDSLTGVEIFAVEEWADRTAENKNQWVANIKDYSEFGMPYGPDDFVAIGHPRGASNYIHFITRGPCAGKIFWWAWTMPPRSEDECSISSFSQFISSLHADPVHLLNETFLCYTRYSDGKTNTQWIPKQYFSTIDDEKMIADIPDDSSNI